MPSSARPGVTPRSSATARRFKSPPLMTGWSSTCSLLATADEDSSKGFTPGWWSWPLSMRLSHGQGRRAAAALVILIALVHVAAGDRLWSPARNLVFDAYQRFMPRPVARFPAVIIDIDERSL